MICKRELERQGLPTPRTCPLHGLKCPKEDVERIMSIEQMIKAGEETLTIAFNRQFHNRVIADKDLTYDHLTEMIIKMRTMDDPGKVGRWLGWIQCAVVACHCATMDELRILNKSILEGTYRE